MLQVTKDLQICFLDFNEGRRHKVDMFTPLSLEGTHETHTDAVSSVRHEACRLHTLIPNPKMLTWWSLPII